jgi:hypothetical protein
VIGPSSVDIEASISEANGDEYAIAKVEGTSCEERAASIKKIGQELESYEKPLLILGGPMTKNECYLMKENKIIPRKVLFMKNYHEQMIEFYSKSGKSEEEAELLIEEELTHLDQVKAFYNQCWLPITSDNHSDVTYIDVAVN